MPNPCTVCAHPQREAIDRALVTGESPAAVAARFSTVAGTLGRMAVQRHKASHLPTALSKAKDAAEVAHGNNLLDQVETIRQRALAILDKTEQSGDYKTALSAIREARGCLELLGKLLGELDERPVINLLVAPEWIALRTRLMDALQPYPEARLHVARVLTEPDVLH